MASASEKNASAAKKPVGNDVKPSIGDRAPAFSLPATGTGPVSGTELRGQSYILYFYPKNDTSGCTAQACGFRDALPAFSQLKTTVIGISKDSLKSHEKFADKYQLNFSLASDEAGTTCAAFGVWTEKSMYGRKYMGIERSTFLIDGEGIVRGVWRKVSVSGHVDEVRKALAAL